MTDTRHLALDPAALAALPAAGDALALASLLAVLGHVPGDARRWAGCASLAAIGAALCSLAASAGDRWRCWPRTGSSPRGR